MWFYFLDPKIIPTTITLGDKVRVKLHSYDQELGCLEVPPELVADLLRRLIRRDDTIGVLEDGVFTCTPGLSIADLEDELINHKPTVASDENMVYTADDFLKLLSGCDVEEDNPEPRRRSSRQDRVEEPFDGSTSSSSSARVDSPPTEEGISVPTIDQAFYTTGTQPAQTQPVQRLRNITGQFVHGRWTLTPQDNQTGDSEVDDAEV